MRRTSLCAAVALLIGAPWFGGPASAQCRAVAADPPASAAAAHAGTDIVVSVRKERLPPLQMQPGQPVDPNLRLTEPEHFVKLQLRIAGLRISDNACPHHYHVAKAQAWLNFSRDQYHERVWQKDIQRLSFDEARRIVEALEAGRDPGMDTPLLAGAQRIRPDLWAIPQGNKDRQAEQLCGVQAQTAYCEVQLVWSGHVLANLGGWRHASSHVRMAEDLCTDARPVCPEPPRPAPPQPAVAPPPPPPPAPSPPPPAPPRYEKITLEAGALFRHAQSSADQILPAGRAQLELLARRLAEVKGVERIVITGHADVTNSSGDPAFNDRLSLARANAVRSYLTRRGADMSRTEVTSEGDRQPVKTDCPAPKGSDGVRIGSATRAAMNAYIDCLQPNRRVEIEIFATDLPR